MASSSAMTTRLAMRRISPCPGWFWCQLPGLDDQLAEELVLAPLQSPIMAEQGRPGARLAASAERWASAYSCPASGVSDTSDRMRASSAASLSTASCSSSTASSSRTSTRRLWTSRRLRSTRRPAHAGEFPDAHFPGIRDPGPGRLPAAWPGWRNGRREGLKSLCPSGRAGSSPAPGTDRHSENPFPRRGPS